MFESARIKLTAWYLLIIMVVSLFFSFAIYSGINNEFGRIEQFEKRRQEDEKKGFVPEFEAFLKDQQNKGLPTPPNVRITRRLDPQMIRESRTRLIVLLGVVNGCILFLAGFAGYFLAGRTLRPIKDMLDEQNRFVTDASHELRTPLTSLKSSIEVSLRDNTLTTQQAKKVLESNLEEVNSLQVLSDSLIELTQYPNGSKKLFEKLSVDALLLEATKKVSSLAKQKHIAIEHKKTDALVFGEKQSLIELVVIILDNAIKYSFEKTSITITVKTPDGKVLITIVDQGIGIDPKDFPHIFDRFYRADKSRSKNDTPGYGLGLSIAKHIALLHKGSLHAESIVGKGTTFSISLPKYKDI
jgi:two-component system sensor histidine kinase CiaH